MKAFLGFTLRSKSASDSHFRRAVPRWARAWTWCQLERLEMRALVRQRQRWKVSQNRTKKSKKPWTPPKNLEKSNVWEKILIKSWLPAAALCLWPSYAQILVRMCHTTPNESEKTWTYRRGKPWIKISWSPYHRKAGKNWSPKTLKINILLVKRNQKERPRLEMTRASRITCALKMSWKLKTAHRTIRCGMPWASQQGSILFLQRKLTKASGFFTPAELIWEGPYLWQFSSGNMMTKQLIWGCLLPSGNLT